MRRIVITLLAIFATIGAIFFLLRFWLIFVVILGLFSIWYMNSSRGKRWVQQRMTQYRQRSRRAKFRVIDNPNKKDSDQDQK